MILVSKYITDSLSSTHNFNVTLTSQIKLVTERKLKIIRFSQVYNQGKSLKNLKRIRSKCLKIQVTTKGIMTISTMGKCLCINKVVMLISVSILMQILDRNTKINISIISSKITMILIISIIILSNNSLGTTSHIFREEVRQGKMVRGPNDEL